MLPTGLPLTNPGLSKYLRTVLTGAARDFGTQASVHGMRRGSARAAAREGADIEAIKTQGTWRGRSVHTYVPKSMISAAPRHVAAAFGK